MLSPRGGGAYLPATSGEVTYEEPSAKERELPMGFSCGFTTAREILEHTRRELLGQAMDLNSVMWILAAARAAGRGGGEVAVSGSGVNRGN
jgi:hypothetical protein